MPEIAQKQPYEVKLQPGEYYWCQCGKSSNQPFCDGSHQGSEYSPVKLTVSKTRTYFLCGCKHTNKAPNCDGSHAKLN